MNQYSEKNQAWLIEQCAERGMQPPTDVKSFKAHAAEGRRVKKGEKALKVWCPILKRGKLKAGEVPSLEQVSDEDRPRWFKAGNVFDVQQTETIEEWKARLVREEQEVSA